MSFVLPEVVVQKLMQIGIRELRSNKTAFYDIFQQFTCDELNQDYGMTYLDQIWNWFSTTKIPVVQAWSMNVQKIPCISIHLANETEDESKAAIGDYAGVFDGETETNTGVFTVMVDVGIHANRAGDHVLWLYYIVAYILFKHKPMAHRLGLKLQTFSASDYNKEPKYMTENIFTRWVRFRVTTENFWAGDDLSTVDKINIQHTIGDSGATDIASTGDIEEIDTTANQGLTASRVGDDSGDDDLNI